MKKIFSKLGTFIKFGSVSLTSSLIDMGLFQLSVILLRQTAPAGYIFISTVLARIASSLYNFGMNRKIVFKSSEGLTTTAIKYFGLVIVQMLSSAFLVDAVHTLTGFLELAVKILVDTCLFLLSYQIQKHLIFRQGRDK